MRSDPQNLGTENQEQFQITSRREIVSFLRSISEKKQLISLFINDNADVVVTSILEVDAENDTVIIDCSMQEDQNRRIVAAKGVSFETTLDQIRILFSTDKVETCMHDNLPALTIHIPESMLRLQRREFYRINTPLNNPVRCVLPLPDDLGGYLTTFPLVDISGGGAGILDDNMLLDDAIGRNYKACRIELPDVGIILMTLQVRNSRILTLFNNKKTRRLGCIFVDIPKPMLSHVQRYIMKLERERNAKITGLG